MASLRKRLKVLVLCELMKMVDRVRQPGKLALVGELHDPVQIVLLGGHQPGVFSARTRCTAARWSGNTRGKRLRRKEGILAAK